MGVKNAWAFWRKRAAAHTAASARTAMPAADLFVNQRVAVDATGVLHKHMHAVSCSSPDALAEYLWNVYHCTNFRAVRPRSVVYVLDGPPHPAKTAHEHARRAQNRRQDAQRTQMTRRIQDSVQRLLGRPRDDPELQALAADLAAVCRDAVAGPPAEAVEETTGVGVATPPADEREALREELVRAQFVDNVLEDPSLARRFFPVVRRHMLGALRKLGTAVDDDAATERAVAETLIHQLGGWLVSLPVVRTTTVPVRAAQCMDIFFGLLPRLQEQGTRRIAKDQARRSLRLSRQDLVRVGQRFAALQAEAAAAAAGSRQPPLPPAAVMVAPHDGEALCGYLCTRDLVDLVVAHDGDAFAYGAERLVTNFPADTSEVWNRSTLLRAMDLDPRQFVDFCILAGCDLAAYVTGMGPETAWKCIREHGTLEACLANLPAKCSGSCDGYTLARQDFANPLVSLTSQQPETVHLLTPAAGLEAMLVPSRKAESAHDRTFEHFRRCHLCADDDAAAADPAPAVADPAPTVAAVASRPPPSTGTSPKRRRVETPPLAPTTAPLRQGDPGPPPTKADAVVADIPLSTLLAPSPATS